MAQLGAPSPQQTEVTGPLWSGVNEGPVCCWTADGSSHVSAVMETMLQISKSSVQSTFKE